jgi:multidrug efflux pump subunit AcrA (membrane-fusion protein)
MIRKLSSLALSALFLGGAIGGVWYMLAHPRRPEFRDPQVRPIVVETEILKSRTVLDEIRGFGNSVAIRQASVSAQVAGQVVLRDAEARIGRPVQARQILFQIDDADHEQRRVQAKQLLAQDEIELERLTIEEANIERLLRLARDDLELAQSDLNRVEKLYEAGQAAQTEVVNSRLRAQVYRTAIERLDSQHRLIPVTQARVESQRVQHKADLKLAKLNVERCQIRAPFDGRITGTAAEVGDLVAPGAVLFSMIDPHQIEVGIELPISSRFRVQVGNRVELTPAGEDWAEWHGDIVRISPQVDERNRTITAYVEVDNRDLHPPLLPGTFAEAHIWGPQMKDVVLLPRRALLGGRAFVVENGRARERRPGLGRTLPNRVVVKSGFKAGDEVILTNLDILADGLPVETLKTPLAEGDGREDASVGG